MIRKVLIANRGEIACRVMNSARALGLDTVAVHSEADARAKHVTFADAAVQVGSGSAAATSYLDADAVLAAARATGADCIHPVPSGVPRRGAFFSGGSRRRRAGGIDVPQRRHRRDGAPSPHHRRAVTGEGAAGRRARRRSCS